jgi:hypothetical protein
MRYTPLIIILIEVYCRSKWDDGKSAGKVTEDTDEEGYLNLGKLVGASSSRGMAILYL